VKCKNHLDIDIDMQFDFSPRLGWQFMIFPPILNASQAAFEWSSCTAIFFRRLQIFGSVKVLQHRALSFIGQHRASNLL
jgi:hypothetical protein